MLKQNKTRATSSKFMRDRWRKTHDYEIPDDDDLLTLAYEWGYADGQNDLREELDRNEKV